MANLPSHYGHALLCLLIVLLGAGKSSSQFIAIQCYECTNCTGLRLTSTSSSYIRSNCYACYKLEVSVQYAPYNYVVRRCLKACIETSQTFSGASIVTSCCATNLCNRSSIKTLSALLLLVLPLLHLS